MFQNKLYCKSSEDMSEIPDKSIDLMVTSPPYNIDITYGNKWEGGKIKSSKGDKYHDNIEESQYRDMLGKIIKETIRCLKDDGSMYINIKNRYIDGEIIPPFWITELCEGMHLKNIIIWNFDWGGSTNTRFNSRYEYIFFFTKDNKKWTFNIDEIKVPSVNYRPDRYKTQLKNPTDVWRIPLVSGNSTERTSHPAQYPEKLIERIIKCSSNPGDVILDPFIGSGTTAVVAKRLGRAFVGYDSSREYINIASNRLNNE